MTIAYAEVTVTTCQARTTLRGFLYSTQQWHESHTVSRHLTDEETEAQDPHLDRKRNQGLAMTPADFLTAATLVTGWNMLTTLAFPWCDY